MSDDPGVVPFGARLAAAFASSGQLCVGIDPHAFLLQQWGLPDDAGGVRDFGLRVVEATGGRAGIVKPQVAFFERHGSAGLAALEDVLDAARAAGLVVIADVKRGDVGTSVDAYAAAWLIPGSPLEADAVTMSAYQGVGSLAGVFSLAERHGKGAFVLAATSNPEAADIQTAVIRTGSRSGMTVAAGIVADVRQWNADRTAAAREAEPAGTLPVADAQPADARPADIGVVLGATVPLPAYGIDVGALAEQPATPILAPGFGHQGADLRDLATLYGNASPAVIVSASRSILSAGPLGITAAIERHTSELAA